jgi:hypothetical protein
MPSPNILLILMLAAYAIPVALIYFKYCTAADVSCRSISSIITSKEPFITYIASTPTLPVFQTRHFIAACMFVMAIFTVLYEHQRCEMYLNSARWSLSAIVVLLLGIFGVIYVPETNPVHYIFAAAAFFAIIGFMAWHTWWHDLRLSDNLRLLLYAQFLFMVVTVIGVFQDAPIFAVEALFLMNFALFYLYIHFNCFSPFLPVKIDINYLR